MKHHRRTRRLGIRLVLVFLLGVVTTVGVSWMCALPWLDNPSVLYMRGVAVRGDLLLQVSAQQSWRERREIWLVRDITRETWDSERVRKLAYAIETLGAANAESSIRSDRWGPLGAEKGKSPKMRIDDYAAYGPPGSFEPKDIPDPGVIISRVESGWPFFSMGYFYTWSFDPTFSPPTPEIHSAIEIPRQYFGAYKSLSLRSDMVALPLGVLWRGFAANFAIYACFWALILIVPRESRRVIRHRHGRCIHCGYDLLGEYDAGCPECGDGRIGHDHADSSPASI